VARVKKQQKINVLTNGLLAMRSGEKPSGSSDGSIRTYPQVQCYLTNVLEKVVAKDVTDYLKTQNYLKLKRMNVGAGYLNNREDYGSYGISGAGDLVGWIAGTGQHIEVELKRGHGGKLSWDQQTRMQDCWYGGAIFLVVHGVPELKYFVHLLKENALTFELALGKMELVINGYGEYNE